MKVERSGGHSPESRRVVDPVTQQELELPIFATAEAVVARAARKRSGEIRTIRFFPDHGHRWPLWDPEAGYTATPDDYGLTTDLSRALREWYDEWETAVGPGDGWSDEKQQERWEVRGDELAARLAREVWDIADVAPEYRPRS